jgi:hypothetical protein
MQNKPMAWWFVPFPCVNNRRRTKKGSSYQLDRFFVCILGRRYGLALELERFKASGDSQRQPVEKRSDLTTDPQIQFAHTKWILTCAFAHIPSAKLRPLRSNPNGIV